MKEAKNIEEMLKAAMINKTDPRIANTKELLTENDKTPVEVIKKDNTMKRRCANCTCSRSKGTNVEITPDCPTGSEPQAPIAPPKGGCGSCSKGDAFRCAGCPYRGMPAFEEGQKFEFYDNLNDV